MYAGVVWLLLLIGHLSIFDCCVVHKDQWTNTTKAHVLKRLDYVSKFGKSLHTQYST